MESKNKDISRAAMMVALTVVLFATKGFIVGLLLIPVPLVLLGSEKGPKFLLMSIACVVACLAILYGLVAPIIYFVPFGAISLILGLGFYYRYSLINIFMIGALLLGGLTYVEFQYGEILLGLNTKQMWEKFGKELGEQITDLKLLPLEKRVAQESLEYRNLAELNESSSQVLDEKKQLVSRLKQEEIQYKNALLTWNSLFEKPMPIFVAYSLMMLLIVYALSKFTTRRFRLGNIPPMDFSNWHCPGIVSFIFVICVFGTSYLNKSDFALVVEVMKSISFTMEFMYFLFGLSFVTFLSMRWKLSRTSRVLLYLVSLFYWPFLIMIGLMDSLVNMRKLYIVDVNKGA